MLMLKLRSIGNSIGLVPLKEALTKLNMGKDDFLFLTEAPDGYRLTPYSPAFEQQIEAAKQIMKDRREALRELAQ